MPMVWLCDPALGVHAVRYAVLFDWLGASTSNGLTALALEHRLKGSPTGAEETVGIQMEVPNSHACCHSMSVIAIVDHRLVMPASVARYVRRTFKGKWQRAKAHTPRKIVTAW